MPNKFPKIQPETFQWMAEALWRFDNRKDMAASDILSEDLRTRPEFQPYLAFVAVTLVAIKEFIEHADEAP